MPDYTFPVLWDNARVTSGIGPRNAPTAGASTWHKGIDIAAPTGTPVVAPTDLEVIFAGTKGGYGNVIYGQDNAGNVFRFGHLDSIGVSQGSIINQGGMLGTVGSTGTATGSHLHFEVRDRAGNLLREATNNVVNAGKKLIGGEIDKVLKGGIAAVLGSNPATAPFAIGANMLGIGGDGCGINPICHFRKWLEETDFVERSALYFIGTIFIIGGIAFLALGYKPSAVVKKAMQ